MDEDETMYEHDDPINLEDSARQRMYEQAGITLTPVPKGWIGRCAECLDPILGQNQLRAHAYTHRVGTYGLLIEEKS